MAFFVFTANTKKDVKSNPPPPRGKNAGKPEIHPAPQPPVASSAIMLPVNVAGNAVNAAAPNMTTVTPQPVIVNNQVLLANFFFFKLLLSGKCICLMLIWSFSSGFYCCISKFDQQ